MGLGFKCGECPPGYSGDGMRCNDVNEVKLQFLVQSNDSNVSIRMQRNWLGLTVFSDMNHGSHSLSHKLYFVHKILYGFKEPEFCSQRVGA